MVVPFQGKGAGHLYECINQSLVVSPPRRVGAEPPKHLGAMLSSWPWQISEARKRTAVSC